VAPAFTRAPALIWLRGHIAFCDFSLITAMRRHALETATQIAISRVIVRGVTFRGSRVATTFVLSDLARPGSYIEGEKDDSG
jgi:hypothetical protein